MKNLILFGFLMLITSFNLSAQNKKEKITQLFAVMRTDIMINSMVDNMSTMFKQQSIEFMSTQNDSVYTVYMAYVMEETNSFTRKLINEDMVEIYDKYFNIEDIQKFIDFYNTPEAQKLLDVTPNIQQDIMKSVMSKYLPELQEKFKSKLEELMKK